VIGVSQICLERRDDDARLDRDEVNPDECHANPRVDDNPFVEDAVEDVDQIPPFAASISTDFQSPRADRGRLTGADRLSENASIDDPHVGFWNERPPESRAVRAASNIVAINYSRTALVAILIKIRRRHARFPPQSCV
jgi:hypothetical protein